MRLRAIHGGTAALVLAAAVSLQAHHSVTAEYDPKAPVTLVGRITNVEWMNPHSFIAIESRTPDGTVDSWRVEVGPPATLARLGITRDMLAVGAVVSVNGVRAKNGSKRAWGYEVTFSNGTTRKTDDPEGAVRPNSAEVPLTLQPVQRTELRPPTPFEQLMSSAPFLPYLVGVVPVVVLLAGLLIQRRRRGPPSVPQ